MRKYKVNGYKIELGANLEGADLRGANLFEANLEGANLFEANLRGADLEEADLSGADLRGANLYGANLRGANLYGASLFNANLKGANLISANLKGANIYDIKGKDILTFQASKDFAYACDGYIKIGCKTYKVEYWLENYGEIGRAKGYTDQQIKDYGNFIKYVSKRGIIV